MDRQFPRGITWWVAAGVGLLMLGGERSSSLRRRPVTEESPRALLAAAARGMRYTEGRLYGFDAASRRVRTYDDRGNVYEVAVHVERELKRPELSISESQHGRGLLMLLVGKHDAAIVELRAAAEENRSVEILNDLGVALLERGLRRRSSVDLVEAFEVVDEALSRDGSSPEASFNRALLAQHLGARTEAVATWKRVLDREGQSPWAAEAREQLRKLHSEEALELPLSSAQLVRTKDVRVFVERRPQEVRLAFEDELTGRWADAQLAGDNQQAEQLLRTLRAIAVAFADVHGVLVPMRTVEAIEATASDETHRHELARAHAMYRDAITLYRNLEFSRAEPLLADAAVALEQAASPFADLAFFYLASSRSYANDIDGALGLLGKLETHIQTRGLEASPLFGHVQWVKGRSLLNRGLPYASLVAFRKARTVFEGTHELEGIAALHDLLAWNYEFLGDEEQAWSHYIAALSLLGGEYERRQRTVLHDASDYAMNHGRSRTALLYATALVELARKNGKPHDVARALLDRSRALQGIGDSKLARAALDEAWALQRSVSDRGLRADLAADLAVAATEVEAHGEEALDSFDRAIEAVTRVEKQTVLPRLWIGRARAARAIRRDAEAERSLRAAISVIERQRSNVSNSELEIEFAEEWYHAFDQLIDLLLTQDRTVEALEWVERSRTQALMREMTQQAVRQTTTVELMRRFPSNACVIVYLVLEDRTAVWIVRRDGSTYRRLAATRRDVDRLVSASASAMSAEDGISERTALERLTDAIFEPVADLVRPEDRIVFVPDRILQAVPFAALYNRKRHRWLVEDHAVSIAPSLRLIAVATERDRALRLHRMDRILVVGDPNFDHERFPDLPRLKGAREEARRVALLYPEATMLLDDEATRSAFLRHAVSFPVVHLALHAVANAEHPALSALLLAPDPGPGGDGLLYAHQVSRHEFSATRLVILAACGTQLSRRTHYEGPLGLARRFLAAGVPNVIATLWDVDDGASAELLVAFHQHLRAGDDAMDALRKAQLSMIQHANPHFRHPGAWAGFQIIGGFLQR